MTFGFWYKLSEELYHIDDDSRTVKFRTYIEQLIGALCRHCQMEPDYVSRFFPLGGACLSFGSSCLIFFHSLQFDFNHLLLPQIPFCSPPRRACDRRGCWRTVRTLPASARGSPNWSKTLCSSSARPQCSSTASSASEARVKCRGRRRKRRSSSCRPWPRT